MNKNKTPKLPNDREIIFNVLCSVLLDGRFSNETLRHVKSEHMPFITECVYGVVERKVTLDYIFKSVSKLPDKKVDDKVRVLLFMGIYELCYTKSKDYAVIYETVEIAKKHFHVGAVKFINGILRQIQRTKCELIEEINNLSPQVKYSVSYEFYALLKEEYSDTEIEKMLVQSLKSPNVHIYVRRNIEKIENTLKENKVNYEKKDDFLILEGFNYDILRNYLNYGDAAILDYSTSAVRDALNHIGNKKIETVIDLCAAPGGKTLLISDYLNAPKIVSQDINNKRVELLTKNLQKWRLNNAISKLADATNYEGGSYDLVICDVPCTGSGVIKRRPELKYKIDKKAVEQLNVIQKKILMVANKYVEEDGYIIYSTCSILKYENEAILEYAKSALGLNVVWCKYMDIDDLHEGFFVSLLKR
ncbi:MAG: methyltransferase domain-containing protein [Ezakiella sp.]|nr:methyltransferase domain-containing protein [Ezakiella sp.]MDD7471761.1 transcription antitermination factor NusB [Bacillota bacterium]MDY3923513.1 transcription antitermination factor NusB [Ezakiella sp.]